MFYLSESESIYDKIINDIAHEYGKEYVKEVKLKVLGTPEHDTARIVIRELELPLSPEEFLFAYKSKVREELQNPSLMPGAKDLILHLHKHSIPIAVATSSSQEAMEIKTKHLQEVFKLFHHIVCGSTDPEVKHGKPAPDIFLVCASRFPGKPDPTQVSFQMIYCLQSYIFNSIGKTSCCYECDSPFCKMFATLCV